MRRSRFVGTRWLGVGLASILAVVTLGLAATGRLGLYVNPDSAWFTIGMAVVVLIGAVASFTLPLGAEADHGHDHGEAGHDRAGHDHGGHDRGRAGREGGDAQQTAPGPAPHDEAVGRSRHPVSLAATAVGGAAASVVVVLTLVLPPASLSAQLAMSRDVGAPPLFAGSDVVALATTGDTSQFGIGEWATVFATATSPDAFDGQPVTLTGFVTPGGADFQLTRLVITHCVIDAQPASVPIAASGPAPDTGQWVTVSGMVRSSSDGRLVIDASSVEPVDEPQDPYEF